MAVERAFIPLRIAVLTSSDSRTEENDTSGKLLVQRLTDAGHLLHDKRIVKDDIYLIREALSIWIADPHCSVVLTTGGTGPALRDVTPEATLAIADRVMPGFGEQMRQVSLRFVPTAILSRQVAVIRKQALIINLPGQPKAIRETLEGLKDASGKTEVPGIFAAVPYCIDLIGGPYIETHDSVVRAFRPKSAQRPIPAEPQKNI
jgi:molybdopterin adenylyltransferase